MSVFRNLLLSSLKPRLITDGLHFHIDALNNTGQGIMDTAATTWVDLVGGNNIPMDLTKAAWQDGMALQKQNGLFTAVTPDPVFTTSGAMTLEIVSKISPTVNDSFGIWIANMRGNAAFVPGEWQVYKRSIPNGGKANVVSWLSANANDDVSASMDGDYGYLAITMDNDFVYTAYSEGVKTKSAAGGSGRVANVPLTLFCPGWTNALSYAGTGISSIRIYNRALSEAEIANNYKYDKDRFGI